MPKPNWGNVGSGALGGAAVGSSILPGWGTAAGGILGGLLGLLGGNDATDNKITQKPTGTAAQQQFGGQDIIGLLQKMMGQGGGFNAANQYDQSLLGQGPEAFQQFSQPYLQQFKEQILPGIEERYAGMGALSSSGFGQAVGGAQAGLQSQLAQLFTQLQGQASGRQQGQFQGLAQTGLGYEPFAYHEQEGSAGSFMPFMAELLKLYGGSLKGGS